MKRTKKKKRMMMKMYTLHWKNEQNKKNALTQSGGQPSRSATKCERTFHGTMQETSSQKKCCYISCCYSLKFFTLHSFFYQSAGTICVHLCDSNQIQSFIAQISNCLYIEINAFKYYVKLCDSIFFILILDLSFANQLFQISIYNFWCLKSG